MALETIAKNFGSGGSHLSGTGNGSLKKILTELQGLSFGIHTGVADNADISNVGIVGTSTIVAAMNLTDTANLDPTKFTPGTGKITNKTGGSLATKQILFAWLDKAGA